MDETKGGKKRTFQREINTGHLIFKKKQEWSQIRRLTTTEESCKVSNCSEMNKLAKMQK